MGEGCRTAKKIIVIVWWNEHKNNSSRTFNGLLLFFVCPYGKLAGKLWLQLACFYYRQFTATRLCCVVYFCGRIRKTNGEAKMNFSYWPDRMSQKRNRDGGGLSKRIYVLRSKRMKKFDWNRCLFIAGICASVCLVSWAATKYGQKKYTQNDASLRSLLIYLQTIYLVAYWGELLQYYHYQPSFDFEGSLLLSNISVLFSVSIIGGLNSMKLLKYCITIFTHYTILTRM